jgi:hypothetical protein
MNTVALNTVIRGHIDHPHQISHVLFKEVRQKEGVTVYDILDIFTDPMYSRLPF